jgi:chromosome partitioning protein
MIAVSNWKGGTGKTTVAVNLGAALVERGQRVLVVDCDAQADATDTLLGQREPDYNLYHLLQQQARPANGPNGATLRPEDLVQDTARVHLDLLPAGPELAPADMEFGGVFRRENLLQRALGDLPQRYDVVLLDCPPSLGLLTHNALVVARWVLIPVEAEHYSTKGMAMMIRTIQVVQEQANPDLAVLGVVVARYEGGKRGPVVFRQLREQVGTIFPGLLYEQPIPRAVAVVESQVMRQTVVDYAPRSPVSLAYLDLAGEVLARLEGAHG